MLRIDGTDKNYIEKLLIEMETDKNNTYEINVREDRKNSEIETISIFANKVKGIDF